MTTLAWINEQTNICENTSLDDRPASDIAIPGYIILDLAQTQAAKWEWNGTEWVVVDENIGEGGIGDTWDGTKLIEPKPNNPQETT